jgi:hypothetical protein
VADAAAAASNIERALIGSTAVQSVLVAMHINKQMRETPKSQAFGLDEKSEETVIGVRNG